MAFATPQFNLDVDIYSMFVGYDFNDRVLRLSSTSQLRAHGQHPRVWSAQLNVFTEFYGEMSILVPAGTDLRDASCTGFADIVDLPSGSNRWYAVMYVDDVAKGFDNEYRFGTLAKIGPENFPVANNFPFWPVPIP